MRFVLIFLFATVIVACNPGSMSDDLSEDSSHIIPEILPFHDISLDDLSAFVNPGANWQVAKSVWSDLNEKLHIQAEDGTGVLVNLPTDDIKTNLVSVEEHGDLEIKFEVMMPKESNSGFYFQSRYELQLFDSWGKKEISHADIGGIYERWDDDKPEGMKGYEGTSAKVNAAKAPGLWQQFHVYFRAPRFDAQGNKTANAAFEYVYLNGMLIHENVEMSGPTRGASLEGETATGPFTIQGDHGPVAFQNIQYKTYGLDTLALTDIAFDHYRGKWDFIPDFDSLFPAKSGKADFLDLTTASDQPDHYGVIFKAKLHVPKTGDYLFETAIDDGGDLYIDSQLVVHNLGEPGIGIQRGLTNLEAGVHDVMITYYQEIWLAMLVIQYEGPGMSKRTLASQDIIAEWRARSAAQPPLTVTDLEEPEMLGGFTNHGENKLTHTLSIGDPSGLHYSYDLLDGFLIKSWRGDYADVTEMWRGRGESQLVKPLNAAVEFSSGVPIARLSNPDASWPAYKPEDYRYRGYRIDEDSRPIFQYTFHDMQIEDKIMPGNDGKSLSRSLNFSGDESSGSTYYRLQTAHDIISLPNGLYNMGGQYYLQLDGEATLAETPSGSELRIPVLGDGGEQSFSYNILW
ncbi:MAG: DUF1080 domain-containing protein [Saprospiraceae bacterium]|nr:DUF1080 domain-containing protein [Saprospiraceae bacterium]